MCNKKILFENGDIPSKLFYENLNNTEGLLWTARRAHDEHSAGFTDSDFGGVIDAVTFGQRRLQNSRAG